MFCETNLTHFSLQAQIAILSGMLIDDGWYGREDALEYYNYLLSVADTLGYPTKSA